MQTATKNKLHTAVPLSTEATKGLAVLIAPLNWGLGHASRCVPIVREQLAAGHQVTLAGDGESLSLLRKHFPELPVVHFPHLELRYSAGKSQVGAMFRALPRLIWWSVQDHLALKQILGYQHFDVVISDNRFGLWRIQESRTKSQDSKVTRYIYITHQLMIKMPRKLRWAEPIVHWLHGRIIRKYDECWIPDFAGENNLSGDLAHKYPLPENARFIGPVSRFEKKETTDCQKGETQCMASLHAGEYRTREMRVKGVSTGGMIVAVLSGLEPQRSMLEKELLERYKDREMLLVRGKVNEAFCKIQRGKVTVVPYLDDTSLVSALLDADKIISRSGYSSIMDFATLGVVHKTEWIPTAGQTEQEYLAQHIRTFKSAES